MHLIFKCLYLQLKYFRKKSAKNFVDKKKCYTFALCKKIDAGIAQLARARDL